jgi:tetratricopeptide (TPR) repeat protein
LKKQALVIAFVLAAAHPAFASVRTATTPDVVASQLVESLENHSTLDVSRVSRIHDVDAWILVDTLLRRGETRVAEAVAAATPGPEGASLAAYVRARAGAGVGHAVPASARLGGTTPAPLTVQRALDLHGDGLASVRLGRPAEGLASIDEAGRVASELGWRREEAACLRDGAAAAVAAGDRAGALSRWERCLAAEEARGDLVAVRKALEGIGLAALALGDATRAVDVLETCVRRCAAAGDRRAEGRALLSLQSAYSARGSVPEAIDRGERALARLEAAGDHAGAARAMMGLGVADQRLGRYPRALGRLTRALAVFDGVGDLEASARACAALADVHASLGAYADAIRMGERALQTCRSRGDRDGEASALVALAGIDGDLARRAEAAEKFRAALALREARADKPGVARTLAELGAALVHGGDLDAAREPLERALAIADAVGDRVASATALVELGTLAEAQGDRAGARDRWTKAFLLREASGDRAGVALVLGRLGLLDLAEGKRKDALGRLDRAVREARRLRAGRVLAWTLGALAEVRLASGEYARALDAAREASTVLENVLAGLAEEQEALAREPFAQVYAVGAAAAVALGETAEAAGFLEAGRAGALLEALDGSGSLRRAGAAPELLAAEDAARDEAARAALEHRRAVETGDRALVAEAARALDSARGRAQEAAERTQRDAKRVAGAMAPRPATLEEMQERLAPGDALLLYGLLEKDAVALVVRRDEARVVSLGRISDIQAACEALHLDDPSVDPAPALARVASKVVAPLLLTGATTRLLVSPDGPLSYVPWSLLDTKREVAYLPSGTTLALLGDARREAGRGVLALGDPDYETPREPQALAALRGGLHLVRLPASGLEAAAVGDVTLLGAKATESGLATAIAAHSGRWRAVHLACHGLIDPDRPAFCSLAISPGEGGDGFLSALEVANSDIPADLVVLSACETARGRVVRGEGILGLARAFMCAGAPRVLASLWKVDDEATHALMTAFYKRWKAGSSASKALREAQQEVRSDPRWSHPSYWAAWVLWGLPD